MFWLAFWYPLDPRGQKTHTHTAHPQPHNSKALAWRSVRKRLNTAAALYTQQMWTCYSRRLASKTSCSCISIYAIEVEFNVRLYIRNRCGCATPGGFHQRQAADRIHVSVLLPRLASRSSCVFKYATDVDALLPAAWIKDKLHLTIRNKCGCDTPSACIKIKLTQDSAVAVPFCIKCSSLLFFFF